VKLGCYALRRVLPGLWPVLSLAILLVLIVEICTAVGDPILRRVTTEGLIYVVTVVGLYVFVGNSGIISFGHVSFMLVAAYSTTWLTCCSGLKSTFMPGLPELVLNTNMPTLPATVISALTATLFALLIGLPIMRLSGIAASIALFAILAMMKTIYENWTSVTGGTTSIIGLPLYVSTHVALAWAVFAIGFAYAFQRSRFGLMLRASREDEVAARAAGINVYTCRLLALVISAFIVGVGGVLYVHFLGTVSVDIFWLDFTFITLAMLVVGGRNSLAGAVLGVVTMSVLVELLRRVESGIHIGSLVISAPEGLQEIGLALAVLAILRFRPQGIMGQTEMKWPWGGGTSERRKATP
jgi:branched-chain amino acid transport system permease protein